MKDSRFLTRVLLKDYKSIAACDVKLHPLTFLVGPNGSGKSNFLDALRFVSDALRKSLDHALRDRGGIKEVRRRSSGHPRHFGIRLDFTLKNGSRGQYSFQIGAKTEGAYLVQREHCTLHALGPTGSSAFFKVANGQVNSSLRVAPAAVPDRLYLVNASGLPEFRPVYEALSRMGFYSLSPDRLRDLQAPDPGDLLMRDGSNIASVLAQLASKSPDAKTRIEQYLSKVVPGIRGVEHKVIGPKETLEFRQQVAGSESPWRFLAANMSDGTVRALGVLVALFQSSIGAINGGGVPLVGIEEPEVALHPAAAGVLFDSLQEASRETQVIVTSHSPDLLDDEQISSESLLAVVAEDGVTKIAPLDSAGRTALRDRLYTAGELLRLDQLMPDPAQVPDPDGTQLKLFEESHPEGFE